MSKYNDFARRLDKAFRDMVQEYNNLAMTVTAAESRLSNYPHNYGGGTVYDAEKKAAEALLKAAKEKFRHTAPELLDGFCRTIDSLTAEVEKAVSADCAVNPADIDTNALELLKSGVMGVRDYAAMVDRYSGNKTMSRLIGKYANDARETVGTAGDRQSMAVIAMTANENAGGDVLDQWGGLVAAAKGYCGYRNAYSSGYVQSMQEHWNDGDIQALVENF